MNDPVTDRFRTLSEDIFEFVKAPGKEKVADLLADAAADTEALLLAEAENGYRLAEKISKTKVQFGLLGAACGVAAGAVAGFVVANRKAEAKFSKIADEEIEQMQEHYLAKERVREAEDAKRPISEIVAERGYSSPEVSTPPPMAVQPPVAVTDAAEEDEEPEVTNVFEEATPTHEWDWDLEKSQRRPHKPYVVHVDEKDELGDFENVTLTYYEGDDVLCDEQDTIVDPDDRDVLVGEANLERFGHGSHDVNVVYIRNDRLEILYEVIRSPNLYAEEVHGFKPEDLTHEDFSRRNVRRMREQERDEY